MDDPRRDHQHACAICGYVWDCGMPRECDGSPNRCGDHLAIGDDELTRTRRKLDIALVFVRAVAANVLAAGDDFGRFGSAGATLLARNAKGEADATLRAIAAVDGAGTRP